MAARIFISYRRIDAPKDARSIYERLRREFGVNAVFMDVEGIAYGLDFVEVLERELTECKVLVALIGPGWIDALDAHGRRRLEDENDSVRLEIATALGRNIRVVPVLIDGTLLPRADQLPEALQPMLRWQMVQLQTSADFDAGMDELSKFLRQLLKAEGRPPYDSKRAFMVRAGSVGVAGLAGKLWRSDVPMQASLLVWAAPVLVPPAPLPASPPHASAPVIALTPSFRPTKAPPPVPALSNRPAWASKAGTDRYGRWAELQVGNATQRMRWIESGEFLMGSPPTEVGRYDDEGPQHRVQITRSFWLADTACTQEFWLELLGGANPAQFKSDPSVLPVESVSHDAVVSRFLTALGGILAGRPEVFLPTEAQWEYACRAGSRTAFFWGKVPNHERMNFDRQNRGPVSVKRYAPNAWGLYQMHGNVWEWCDDHEHNYAAAAAKGLVLDPVGRRDAEPWAPRTARGGSWFRGANYCRSAARYADQRRGVNLFLGFRFALRSTNST
jgi:formylglycine-generating enzyme